MNVYRVTRVDGKVEYVTPKDCSAPLCPVHHNGNGPYCPEIYEARPSFILQAATPEHACERLGWPRSQCEIKELVY